MRVLRNELRVTFRVNRMDMGQCNHVRNMIKRFASENEGAIDELKWYPDGCGWQINWSRKELLNGNDSKVRELCEFLQEMTKLGHLWRQEAVSMIPCLFLSIGPQDNILDMCAAPGSKTAQLVEQLHNSQPEGCIVEGLVIANDKDVKRCNVLITQTKKLNSPSLVVTNHDSRIFPKIHKNLEEPLLFDAIICDVPCSGDGTLRKNPDLWHRWSPRIGLSLHKNQVSILSRAISLAAPGAKIIYSTCSLNPVEDEAVIASVLQRFPENLILLDCSDHIPHLKSRPGLSTWKVMDHQKKWYSRFDQLEGHQLEYPPGIFPPDTSSASQLNLNRCMRFYPQDQDTGGFFVAILKKLPSVSSLPKLKKKSSHMQSTHCTHTIPLQTQSLLMYVMRKYWLACIKKSLGNIMDYTTNFLESNSSRATDPKSISFPKMHLSCSPTTKILT